MNVLGDAAVTEERLPRQMARNDRRLAEERT